MREICQKVSHRLDNLDTEGRRAIYAAFGVSVQASREELLITIVVSENCTTTGQTLASSSNSVYSFVVVDLKEVVHYAGGQKVIEFVPC